MLMLLRPVKQATSSAPQPQAVLPCDAERFQRRLLSPDLPLGKNNLVDGRSVQRPMKLPQIPLVGNVKKTNNTTSVTFLPTPPMSLMFHPNCEIGWVMFAIFLNISRCVWFGPAMVVPLLVLCVYRVQYRLRVCVILVPCTAILLGTLRLSRTCDD